MNFKFIETFKIFLLLVSLNLSENLKMNDFQWLVVDLTTAEPREDNYGIIYLFF